MPRRRQTRSGSACDTPGPSAAAQSSSLHEWVGLAVSDPPRGLRAVLRRAREAARRGTSVESRVPAVVYAWRYARWRARCSLGRASAFAGPERLTAVLASFARPQNLAPLVASMLACRFVDRVVVTNHEPSVRIADWVRRRDPRLTLLDAPRAEPPLHRFEVAREAPGERFLILDDDLFLAPVQVRSLFVRLLEDLTVPHGMFGQRVVDPTADDPDRVYRNRVHGEEGDVDVLNRAYLFTRAHLDRFFVLRDALVAAGVPDAGFLDDLLLSRAGVGRPRLHDVGPFLECPSQGDPRIAVWARPGNGPLRLRAARLLDRIVSAVPAT